VAGKGKIVTGALEGLTDAASKVLPENIFDLPSFKEAVRAFKRSVMGDTEDLSVAEKLEIPDAEVDAEDLGIYGFENEKDLFRSNRDPFDDWAAGKIDLQDFQKKGSFRSKEHPAYPLSHAFPSIPPTSGTEFLGGANYPLDVRSYVLRDLEMNYGLSKPEIMDYLKKNDLLEATDPEEFDFSEQQMKALKDAFASDDPDNPIVKRVRGALDDLVDEDDLVEVTPEMIYGKSN
tara:strand:- start:199 stop:897 length:699 start_codon:yes stop_codon:yes gene_type:complete